MSIETQKQDYPAKSYVMKTIQELCGEDKDQLFSLYDIKGLMSEYPEVSIGNLKYIFRYQLSKLGYVEFQYYGKRAAGQTPGRGPALYRITDLGISADWKDMPTYTHVKGKTKKKAKQKLVKDDKTTATNKEDETMSEIEVKVRTDMAKNLLLYIQGLEKQIMAWEYKNEEDNRRNNRICTDLRAEIKNKERDIKRLNDTITQLQAYVKNIKRANSPGSADVSLAKMADKFKEAGYNGN